MNKPSVYILLPVHNRRELTMNFAECLLAQEGCSYHLLLLDDGSIDGTADSVLKLLGNRVTVLRGDGNWWWAGALQVGINWLKSQGQSERTVVLMINDDLVFAPDFLAKGVQELNEHPKAYILARQIDAANGKTQDTGGGLLFDSAKLRFYPAQEGQEIECLPTRGLFCRLGDIIGAGEFKPDLLPHYFSDYEFTIRARRKGYVLKVSGRVCVNYSKETTGKSIYNLSKESICERVKTSFSFGFRGNPMHYTRFALLVVPKLQLPIAMMWIWGNWARNIILNGCNKSICSRKKQP